MHLYLGFQHSTNYGFSWYQSVLKFLYYSPRSPAPGTAAAARSRSPSPTRNNNSSTNGNQSQSVKTKLQLVDLAGSECVGKNRTLFVAPIYLIDHFTVVWSVTGLGMATRLSMTLF